MNSFMKSSTKIYIAALAGALSLQSCDKFLDLEPISQATTANSYKSLADAEAALTGVYDSFQQDYYVWDNVMLSDARSDNHYAGGDNPSYYEMDELRVTANNDKTWSSWKSLYNAIAKANIVLTKVPTINDPKLDANNRRNQIIGEASFLRAYHYFQLVKLFGDIPLMLKPVSTTNASETNVPRSSVADVYKQIIADLEVAATNLPDTYGASADVNKARATKGAANALLAKVYAQKPDRDYTKVLQYANLVITSPAGYSLLLDYDNLFDGNHYNNAESIMEVQYVGGKEANWGPQMLLPPSKSGDGWRKFLTPSKDLIKAFDAEGDVVRKNASVLFENVQWVDEFWSAQVGGSVPFSYKWRSANGWASTNRQYLIRLADIILLKAEALNELGQTTEAAAALDLIRKRVNLQGTTANSKEALKSAIENERRLEFAQEGQRWDDLVRFGNVKEVMNNLNEVNLKTGQKMVYNMTDAKIYVPIPQNEIDRNPLLK